LINEGVSPVNVSARDKGFVLESFDKVKTDTHSGKLSILFE
jgi:hypothetical protein